MEWASSSEGKEVTFDLICSDSGIGCPDDYSHNGTDHRGPHNHKAVSNYRERHVCLNNYSLLHNQKCFILLEGGHLRQRALLTLSTGRLN